MPRRKAMISPHGIMRAQRRWEELTHRITKRKRSARSQAAGKSRVRSIAAESQCVFQLLRKHYSRYTPRWVERITAFPRTIPQSRRPLYFDPQRRRHEEGEHDHLRRRWTQHSFWHANHTNRGDFAASAGNVGRAGVASTRWRGHSNIQGATDMAGLFDSLPGYLKVPTPADTSFDAWMKRIYADTSKPAQWDSFNYYSNTPKFAVAT